MTDTSTITPAFTITRRMAAPPERVWRAWTEPQHLGWFFNPDTAVDEPPTVDLRVGHAWRQSMRLPDGTAYMTGGIYRELVPGRRLVFTWGAEHGWPELDPARPEDGILVAVDLEAAGDGTLMTFTLTLPRGTTEEEAQAWLAKGIRDGWQQTLDRLVAAP